MADFESQAKENHAKRSDLNHDVPNFVKAERSPTNRLTDTLQGHTSDSEIKEALSGLYGRPKSRTTLEEGQKGQTRH